MSEAVVTAQVGRNAALFERIASIYIPKGSAVLDMTWGRGNFWLNLDTAEYRLTRNDIATEADTHEDFRATSFEGRSFDVVVLDPPYALHGKGSPIKASISSPYNLNAALTPTSAKEVREVYAAGVVEARRLLRRGGVLVIKCQDQIESGKQHYIHADLLALEGFVSEDLFVLVQATTPAMRHTYQKHARKEPLVLHRAAESLVTSDRSPIIGSSRYSVESDYIETECNGAELTGVCRAHQTEDGHTRSVRMWTVWDKQKNDHAVEPFPFFTKREAVAWIERHR